MIGMLNSPGGASLFSNSIDKNTRANVSVIKKLIFSPESSGIKVPKTLRFSSNIIFRSFEAKIEI